MIWAYRQNRNGGVDKLLVAGSGKRRGRGEQRPDDHFSQTILKSYYKLECEKGSRFRSGYTKNQIKRTHDTAIARFYQRGEES